MSAATRARYAKRRQRRLARVDNDLTDQQWAAILDAWGGCAYCHAVGPALQRDCVMPISRGGRYTLENVVSACASCNASKRGQRGHRVAAAQEARRGRVSTAARHHPAGPAHRRLSPGGARHRSLTVPVRL